MAGAFGIPLLECVYLVGCAHWAWKRCVRSGQDDSLDWPEADAEVFRPIPHMCRLVLSVYEKDLLLPKWAPPGGYRINLDYIVKRVTNRDIRGKAPPYFIYLDHDNKDIVMAIRGLNLVKESDYAVLLDNKLGKQMFDGGYVHHGLLKSAAWLLHKEAKTLKQLVQDHPSYTLTFAGHSLGAGIAALLTVLVVKNRNLIGNITRDRVRCYAIAPARCMSLNLAVRYADIINSVILQDDFLPRTSTPLEDIFKSIFCLPCLICISCVRDTFLSEAKLLKDPRRLYTPGRVYHIVERKHCRCSRYPPVVRTAVPVDGRFERIVLSSSATSDHSIIWIHREVEKALQIMEDESMHIPPTQKMARQQSLVDEHMEEYKAALDRAVTLKIPHAHSPSSYGTFDDVLNMDSSESENSSNRDHQQQQQQQQRQYDNYDEHDDDDAAADDDDGADSGNEDADGMDKWKKFLRELFPRDRYEKLLGTGR